MASKPFSQLERIAALEVQVKNIQDSLEESTKDARERHNQMDSKLDSILTLKNKGAGAFWLASAIFGTGIVGFLGSLFDWWKGFVNG